MKVLVAMIGVVGVTAVAASPSTPPAPTPKLLEAGKAAYTSTCLACHGATGEGNGPVAFAIKPPPRNFVKDAFKAGDSPGAVFHTITNGLPNTRMVGYPQISEHDRWGVTYYVLALRSGHH
jgi:high-affinity iron transporter